MIVFSELAAVVAVVVALAGQAFGAVQSTVATSSFGGPVPVYVAHVGRIDVDLESGGAGRLLRVACDNATAGTACFLVRPVRH